MRNYKKIVIRKPFVKNFPSEPIFFVDISFLGIKNNRERVLRITHYFVPLRPLNEQPIY